MLMGPDMSYALTRRHVLGSLAAAGLSATVGGPAFANPVKGGALTTLIFPEPPYLLSAVDPTLQMAVVTTKIYEGLLSYDLDMKPHPLLAESWAVAPDGLSYRFNLRKGVKWHDGRDFTADDVAFSLGVWKTRHARGRQSYARVVGVDTPDPHTVVIRLSEPAPQMATVFSSYESPVIPKHIFEGKDLMSNPATTAPIGTGPFRFGSWKRGDNIILERNPTYWQDGKPHLDRIVFRFIADASGRAAALESGEAQIGALTPVPLTDMARLTAKPDLVATTQGYDYMAPVLLLQLNVRNKPLDDRKVRQALASAINRDVLTKTVWFGYGKPATSPVSSVVKAWYTTDGVPTYPYDPKKAEALLDEAGYKRGADGKRFKIADGPVPGRGRIYPHGRVHQAAARAHRRRCRAAHQRLPELRPQHLHGLQLRIHADVQRRLPRSERRAAADLLVQGRAEGRALRQRDRLLGSRHGPRLRGRADPERPEEALGRLRQHAAPRDDRPVRDPADGDALHHARPPARDEPHDHGRRADRQQFRRRLSSPPRV